MQKTDSVMAPLVVAAVAAIAIALFVARPYDGNHPNTQQSAAPASKAAAASLAPTPPAATGQVSAGTWAASAPGRVEPKGGEIRMSPQSAGRITDVLVAVGDKVAAGDLLIKLDDSDAEARVSAAESEASVRRRDRDQETVAGAARDRRTAEDAAYAAERLYSRNRAELDGWIFARKSGLASDADVAKVRDTVNKSREAMDAARTALRKFVTDNLPAQTRLEAAVAAARADVTMADAAAERLHIRAPKDASVLQVSAIVGESVAPSPENVIAIVGDTTAMRVKAELDERDINKVQIGQVAVVRSDSFPGQDFEGRVSAIGRTLSASKLGSRGMRKLADNDVLEFTVDLSGTTPLLSGMRVDVFLRPLTAASAAQAQSR